MCINNDGHDGVSKIVFREDGAFCKRFVRVTFHMAPPTSCMAHTSPSVARDCGKIPWTDFTVSMYCRDFLKDGHDIALRAVKTLAESGSLRVIFNLVHLNLSWIPSLSTLPLICLTLCGHIILAHYAKNNVDSISLAHNMQSWHITFENQGN